MRNVASSHGNLSPMRCEFDAVTLETPASGESCAMPARRFQLERRRAFIMIILYPIRNIFCVGYFPAGSERQRRGTDIGERRSGDIRERKLRCLHRNRFPHRANRPGGGSQVSFTSACAARLRSAKTHEQGSTPVTGQTPHDFAYA